MDRSGIIQIGQNLYTNVNENDIEEIIKELGRGAFGTVTLRMFKCQKVAVKNTRRKGFKDVNFEIISRADSAFIVKYYGYILNEHEINILMEPMSICLEKLYEHFVKPKEMRFGEAQLAKVAIAVVESLWYLKDKHNIMHRDLKPSNILIDVKTGCIKLSDFGTAERMNAETYERTPGTGSLMYISPERYLNKCCDHRSDIWSLGMCLVELAYLGYPFKFQSELELEIMITEFPSPELGPKFTSQFRRFVSQCLEKNEKRRTSYKNLMGFGWYQQHKHMNTDITYWLRLAMKPDK